MSNKGPTKREWEKFTAVSYRRAHPLEYATLLAGQLFGLLIAAAAMLFIVAIIWRG